MHTFGLHDSWSVNNHQAVRFTWRRPGNDANQANRIDRIYFPWDIPIVYDYLSCPYSDHDCVCASLDLALLAGDWTPVTGKPYWKLNCSVLSESGLRDRFLELYSMWQTLNPAYDNPLDWWESVRLRTKDFCIETAQSVV